MHTIEEAAARAVALARRMRHLFIATADAAGLPHLAAAEEMALRADGRLAVTAWFCPQTVVNLSANPRISVVAWDSAADDGLQVLGEAEAVEEVAFLDGLAPGEEAHPLPQVERRIVIRPTRTLVFTLAPHTDREE
ncbi:MAG: pyridoxamine 5'-phosphate oxidase family protein [Thermodesulfobacteriota bacterium]